jgi:hypothetical protein
MFKPNQPNTMTADMLKVEKMSKKSLSDADG